MILTCDVIGVAYHMYTNAIGIKCHKECDYKQVG